MILWKVHIKPSNIFVTKYSNVNLFVYIRKTYPLEYWSVISPSVRPSSVRPSVRHQSVRHLSLRHHSVRPSVRPSSVRPSVVRPSVCPASVRPSIVRPSSVRPSSVRPSFHQDFQSFLNRRDFSSTFHQLSFLILVGYVGNWRLRKVFNLAKYLSITCIKIICVY